MIPSNTLILKACIAFWLKGVYFYIMLGYLLKTGWTLWENDYPQLPFPLFAQEDIYLACNFKAWLGGGRYETSRQYQSRVIQT